MDIYFSENWINNFLVTRNPKVTKKQVTFIRNKISKDEHASILDIGCGLGRHSIMLSEYGYDVIGIDINEELLSQVRDTSLNSKNTPIFLRLDMRDINKLDKKFDAVLSLWQSFGYYSADENYHVLQQIYQRLNPGGILLLDIYNKSYFSKILETEGTREFDHLKGKIIEKSKFENNRLLVSLTYPDTSMDLVEWQLYSIDDLKKISKKIGFDSISFFTDFSDQEAGENNSRIQVIFKK